eukprot:m.66023 g.66023  ORF g.66023 m.66023 type:complete len:1105 (-) comp11779_c0_seq2:55-3369(-)
MDSSKWACSACTFINVHPHLCCAMCGTVMPQESVSNPGPARNSGEVDVTSPVSVNSLFEKYDDIEVVNEVSPNSSKTNGDSHKDKTASGSKRASFAISEAEGNLYGLNWPILLGEAVVVGFSTRSGKGYLNPGDRVTLVRREPQTSVLSKAKGKQPARMPSFKKKDDSNYIVRFECNGREVGRLPAEMTKWLAPLLDEGVVEADGCCVDCPTPSLKTMDQIILQLSLHLQERAIQTDVGDPYENAGGLPEDQVKRRDALVGMLATLGDDMAQKYLDEIREHANTAGPAQIGNTVPEESGEDDGDDLEFVNKKMEQIDALLEEAEPNSSANGMKTSLRGYQKQALGWMRNRERLEHQTAKLGKRLHPSWREQNFGIETSDKWYWNINSGAITVEFPSAELESRGGILADAMGLGKTVEMLSLIVTERADDGFKQRCAYSESEDREASKKKRRTSSGIPKKTTVEHKVPLSLTRFLDEGQSNNPEISLGGCPNGVDDMGRWLAHATLIVCPMSLLNQWREEILQHTHITPSDIYLMYGDTKGCTKEKLSSVSIVLTTFGSLAAQYKLTEEGKKYQNSNIYSMHFFRVVLDEAHMIKNRLSLTSRACCGVSAERRWAMTGTPIQNRLEDLYSLIKFLRIEPYCILHYWNKNVDALWQSDPAAGLTALQDILQPAMLRRTKDTRDKNGEPIVTLPSSSVETLYLEFSPSEQDFYDAVYSRSKTKFNEYVTAGSILSNYANILELLLRLRQACDHPLVTVKRGSTQPRNDSEEAKSNSPAAHTFADIDDLLKDFLQKSQTSGGANGNGLTRDFANSVATQLKSALQSDPDNKAAPLECPICLEDPLDPVVLPCAHVGCLECLTTVIDALHHCPVCRVPMSSESAVPLKREVKKDNKGEGPSASASSLSQSSNDLPCSSAKISALIEQVKIMLDDNKTHKCIVFSQWLTMMTFVQKALGANNINCVRLDGGLSQQERVSVLSKFRDNPSVHVLIMSLRAGGVGLNLTTASHVFLLDPWWNPAVEEQAIDRVHRIGQNKEVTVRRFIIRNSIEERILLLQARKKTIASAVSSEEGRNPKEFNLLDRQCQKEMVTSERNESTTYDYSSACLP